MDGNFDVTRSHLLLRVLDRSWRLGNHWMGLCKGRNGLGLVMIVIRLSMYTYIDIQRLSRHKLSVYISCLALRGTPLDIFGLSDSPHFFSMAQLSFQFSNSIRYPIL